MEGLRDNYKRFEAFPKTMFTARTRSALAAKAPKSNSAMSTRTYSRIKGDSANNSDKVMEVIRKNMNFDEDESRYLNDSSSNLQDMENEQELLHRMLDQQKQLQDLQERQRRILDLHHQLASMDQSTENSMEEKLKKLKAAKTRIDELQNLVGTIKLAESSEKVGGGDNMAKKLNDKNQRIKMALDELDELKSLINMMSVYQHEPSQSGSMVEPVFANVINSVEGAESEDSYRPVLPEVSVVQQDCDDDEGNSVAKSPRKKVPKAVNESTPLKLKPSPRFLSPNYSSKKLQKKKLKKGVKAKPEEQTSEQLWNEMQRHQLLLSELRERRKELEDLMNMTKEESDANQDYNDGNESTRSNIGSPDDSRSISDTELNDFDISQSDRLFGLNESDTRRLIDIIRSQKSLGATTEKTTATWGSSSSDTDESEGEDTGVETRKSSMAPPKEVVEAILRSKEKNKNLDAAQKEDIQESLSMLQEAKKAYDLIASEYKGEHEIDFRPPTRRRRNTTQPGNDTQLLSPTTWRAMIEKLQEDLYNSNTTMHLLLEDQQALTRLLQNTLNLQQTSLSNNMCYGISPDFLIYQLDNCSAQFAALQRETKALQWQLYELTKNQPRRLDKPNISGASRNPLSTPSYNQNFIDSVNKKEVQIRPIGLDGIPVPKPLLDGTKSEMLPYVRDSAVISSTSGAARFTEQQGNEKPRDDGNVGLFEALRDSIYSEAAILISQNECRPHFLIELFHSLQQLNTDYLRQHCLYVLQDVVKAYISGTPKKKLDGRKHSPAKNPKKASFSENTPSDSVATSEDELYAKLKAKAAADAGYDFSLKVSSASELSTPSGEEIENNPFAAEDLGSTVIHLDAALRHMREMERMKQEILGSSAAEGGLEAGQDSHVCGGDGPKNKAGERGSGEVPQINTKLLRARIKHIVSEVIPVLKTNRDKTLDRKFLKQLQQMVVQFASQTTQNDKQAEIKDEAREGVDKEAEVDMTNFFSGQLNSILEDSLQKYIGQRVGACGEDLVISLSEVLFNELAFYHMMQDLDKDKSKAITGHKIPKIKVNQEEEADLSMESRALSHDVEKETEKEEEKDADSDFSNTIDDNSADQASSMTNGDAKFNANPVTVDLSVSETKPLTSYGSGEDEEDGSGDDFTYKETDVPTSIQQDLNQPAQNGDERQDAEGKEEKNSKENESKSSSDEI